jgi:dihydroneopterin aldolase
MRPGSWLEIEGIEFKCTIGVDERERQAPQAIRVSLQVHLDFARVAASDAIQDTVDYRALTRRVIAAGEASAFRLVETLASYLARVILEGFPAVEGVRVEVEKPHALAAARSVRAVIVSRRSGA